MLFRSVDSLRVYTGLAQLRFADGKVRFDSLRVESLAGVLTKSGQNDALGLTSAINDTLKFAVEVDSLGGFRRYLVRPPEAGAGTETIAMADSLEGTARIDGAIVGSLDAFDVQLRLDGRDMRLGATTARHVVASTALRGFRSEEHTSELQSH